MGSHLEGVSMSLLTKLEEMQKSGKKVVSVDYVIVELDRLYKKHRQALIKVPYVSLDAESEQIVYRDKMKA